MLRRTSRHAAILATLFVLYVVSAKGGLALGAVSGFATLVWPPTGIALAGLLLLGESAWPAVWLGAFVVNVWVGAPWFVAAGIATGNTVEAVLGSTAMRRVGAYRGSFDSLRHVLTLLGPVAIGSTFVSATVGVGSLFAAKVVAHGHVLATWRAWWVGDLLGDVVVGALILAWVTPRERSLSWSRAAEAAVLGASLVATSAWMFLTPSVSSSESPSILFPFFVWAALRFELRGATATAAAASAVAVWGTALGAGPFVRESLAASLFALQVFMGCAALTPLVAGAAIAERARGIRVRETFIASVSHDLKNPLNVIQLSSSTLVRALPTVTAERIFHHDEMVQRSVQRMSRLIADLLDAAAIDAGALSVTLQDENARALLDEVADLQGPIAAAKGQKIVVEMADPFQVSCDRVRILQVLSNLIDNAIKFSPDGAEVTLRAERNGDEALVLVRDRGIGITPSDLRHVFERHWRARASREGSGLGLFIARGIVRAHDGRLWAESQPGEGSRFAFTLPLASGEAMPRARGVLEPNASRARS